MGTIVGGDEGDRRNAAVSEAGELQDINSMSAIFAMDIPHMTPELIFGSLQGENSYDFAPTADRPYDEINIIKQGANYGWPYCYDMNQATPAWATTTPLDCNSAAHQKPAALLPPHSAPLGAVYYSGSMFPSLKGKLLMSWHGYRPTGSRIVAFDVDAAGIPITLPHARYGEYFGGGIRYEDYRPGPAAEPLVLTPGWQLKPGQRPAGAPVGITVARDGAIWVADDRNASVLRIAIDRP
jgi:hypothetical protein